MKLTNAVFETYPADSTFAEGLLPNSSEGIFMTTGGGTLRWVAKKGMADDWCIYCHWENKSREFILSQGDKVMTELYIKRCLDCDDEVFAKYRY